MRGGDAEDSADRRRIENLAEHLVIVDTGLLGKAAHNPARLVPRYGAVRVVLVPEQPFASDHIGTGPSRHKAPGTVVDERSILVRYSRQLGSANALR